MSNTLPSGLVPVKVEVLFISPHQLHFGLLQKPQPPIVVVYPSEVLSANLVLTSMSRRLFDRLYAITGRSLNMWASLSFDSRKCQFLFATSAIYEMRGLYVITKGIRLVVCHSLACKLSSCVNDKNLRISDSAPSLLYPHATKKLEYSNILYSSTHVDEHILLSLKAWLYGILFFKCGGCAEVQCRYGWVSVGFWKMSVLMLPCTSFMTFVSRKFTDL